MVGQLLVLPVSKYQIFSGYSLLKCSPAPPGKSFRIRISHLLRAVRLQYFLILTLLMHCCSSLVIIIIIIVVAVIVCAVLVMSACLSHSAPHACLSPHTVACF